jgi:UDP-glucose 4-epimerase
VSKKILIIGNSGFIGNKIQIYFERQNKYLIEGINSKNCNLLNIDECSVKIKNLTNEKCKVIFLSSMRRDAKNNQNVFVNNIKMIANFINSMNTKNIEQFIFFSSTCIYGRPPRDKIINESSICFPNEYYGLSKFMCEKFLINSLPKKKLTILRIPGVYDDMPNENSIIGKFILNTLKNKKITIFNKGRYKRDYLHVDDLMNIIDKIIVNKIFIHLNVVSGKSIKISNIINIISKYYKKNIKVQFKEDKKDKFNLIFDNSLLLGMFPNFKFKDPKKIIKKIFNDR